MNATIEIGKQGKLGNEVLTVVSFTNNTFTCNNGKTYLTERSAWMTEGVIVTIKAKRTKKNNKNFRFDADKYEQEINEKSDVREFDEMQQKSRMNQRSSSLR